MVSDGFVGMGPILDRKISILPPRGQPLARNRPTGPVHLQQTKAGEASAHLGPVPSNLEKEAGKCGGRVRPMANKTGGRKGTATAPRGMLILPAAGKEASHEAGT